ncbi:hypothetical protein ACQU0X_12455 [Pseudovibrio ascidiaceicola]|uniref:hypothetical protein n=1 Tax=Pseudovibrio ascidiaceicola TaxID=285279 RepID=UPI003D360077
MRTPNRVAYWTKTRALMAATLILWLIFFGVAVFYGAPSSDPNASQNGLSGLLVSLSNSYVWGCLLFFVASILISWFCGAQDRLDEGSTGSSQRRGSTS